MKCEAFDVVNVECRMAQSDPSLSLIHHSAFIIHH